MFVTKQEAKRLRKDYLDSVFSEFKETDKFLCDLADEDDWSFIIKSHALIEATVTNLITSAIGDERIRSLIERMPLSDVETGKIAFARQLGVLDKPQIRFIRWYSELRNKLVHKVENVNFDLVEHWATLDKNQKKSWKTTIDWANESGNETKSLQDLVEKQPKTAIWFSLLILITVCSAEAEQARAIKELNKTSEETTKKHFDSQKKLIHSQSELIEKLVSLIDQDD